MQRYTSTKPERATVTLSLTGSSASSFTLSSNGVLTFKNTPDYEDPPGYTVTVNAEADGDTATKTVTINIQNLE